MAALRSGWLTTGPRVKRFEQEFAAAVGAPHAVALNSCTAALHLAVHALGLRPGRGRAGPDDDVCRDGRSGSLRRRDSDSRRLRPGHAEHGPRSTPSARWRISERASALAGLPRDVPVVGMIPVHVGGLMMDVDDVSAFAARHGLWVVEDAAHAFPAAWRRSAGRAVAALRPADRRRLLLLVLRQQDDHHRRRRHGGHRRSPNWPTRMRLLSLHGLSQRRLGPVLGQRRAGTIASSRPATSTT